MTPFATPPGPASHYLNSASRSEIHPRNSSRTSKILRWNLTYHEYDFRASRRKEDEKDDEESLVEQNETKKLTRKKRKVSETSAKIRWGKNKGRAAEADFFPEVYSSNMGGTDRMDQNTNPYRIGIRGKKVVVVSFHVDGCYSQALQIARSRGTNIDQLMFRREVAMAYLFMYKVEPKATGRRKLFVPSAVEMRYDNLGHLVQPLQGHARRKCIDENCKSVVRSVLQM
ncbi:PiggyBac transposable element-derived protein 2 [Portunus trituberculatus]|uniref:PiggyBac transposable element-derived protein 2 n=1 Tax=Portunus trituberculatus TaxID=210409 RepID=A0A5B7F293_PORTR|nr:PiggyBac transposable element-derived protein 2 [Portunus trituberculatus]